MTPGSRPPDWSRVNEVFHRALAAPTDQRGAVVESSCGDDEALAREVRSLLAAHDEAGDLLDQPPVGAALSGSSPPDSQGLRIGHYSVIDVIGTGGMGVVYRAEDTRLGRTVALKALPAAFTSDEPRRERLRREARAAAALNHPGIAAVYALETIDGHLFMASEYVPGETLRQELARGPLPPGRVLETGATLARAVAAAHERGVIHRDLKPDNVIRTPTGELKILDFGIARSLEDRSAQGRLTADDALLGTPAYMAPEQVRGDAEDPRSDLFSLGAMLYEALTGLNPFDAADPAATIARVLEFEPPRVNMPDSRDPIGARRALALERIIFRCLSKNPAGRFRSADELAAACEHATEAHTDDPTPPPATVGVDSPDTAAWWWQFHQGAASAGYLALLALVWTANHETGSITSLGAFFVALVSGVAATLLRLHLWFAVRSYPAEARGQRARVQPWLRRSDIAFAAALLVAGIALLPAHVGLAMTLVAGAVAVVIVFAFIEPATAAAAFGNP